MHKETETRTLDISPIETETKAEDIAFLFNSPEDEKRHNFWDDLVPIVTTSKNTYTAFLASEIDAPEVYNKLCYLLNTAKEGDTIYIELNTPGGHIDSAFKILHSLKKTKARTVAIITGTVASAGTIIALSCDEVEVGDYTQFMIHNYSTGTQGKGHEVMDYVQFTDKNLKATFKKIYSGFLTDKEMNAVIKGKDMWLNDEEVKERWIKMQKKNA